MSANVQTDKNSLRPFRRCVRRVNETPDGIVQCETKSFTNNKDTWHPNFDLLAGSVFCDCPDFTHRCSKVNPTLHSNTRSLCKHLVAALLNAVRRGDLLVSKQRVAELETATKRTKGFSKTHTEPEAEPTCYHSFLATLSPAQTQCDEDVMLQEASAYRSRVKSPDYNAFLAVHNEADTLRHAANQPWLDEQALWSEYEAKNARYQALLQEPEDTDYKVECEKYDLLKRLEEIEALSLDPEATAPYPELLPTC